MFNCIIIWKLIILQAQHPLIPGFFQLRAKAGEIKISTCTYTLHTYIAFSIRFAYRDERGRVNEKIFCFMNIRFLTIDCKIFLM